jgi:hypothetical protein
MRARLPGALARFAHGKPRHVHATPSIATTSLHCINTLRASSSKSP